MTLELVKPWDPILTEPTVPVEDTEIVELQNTFDEMHQIMRMFRGVGLAAPQVGISKSFFIAGNPDDTNYIVFINPEIIKVSEEYSVYAEGCLSLPNMELEITRPHLIEAKWQDRDGEHRQSPLSEMLSRIFLHELDHLQGICMVDRVSNLKAEMAIKRMMKKEF
jgi:peptide deformylase